MTRYQRPEQPKPIGTIIGVVVAMGAILIFMILMATGVISPRRKGMPVSGTTDKGPKATANTTGTPDSSGASAQPSVSGQGAVRFTGRFDEKGNTRKVETLCPNPACGKPVDAGIPKCPSCNAGIKWPEKVKCGFCAMDKPGACGVCQGTGNCPFCSKGPRMLMGVRPPCPACNQSGKCPACEGTAKCGFCEDGFYFPGRTPPPKPPKKLEPPPPEVKPETPATPVTDGAAPAPAPVPEAPTP